MKDRADLFLRVALPISFDHFFVPLQTALSPLLLQKLLASPRRLHCASDHGLLGHWISSAQLVTMFVQSALQGCERFKNRPSLVRCFGNR